MATDYDDGSVAEDYQESKSLLWRERIEDYSFLKLIGDVTGQKVLDIACGEGHFTRMLHAAGAAEVVGVDISERMVELASQQEEREQLGISYHVDDAGTVVPQQDYDLVTAAWLLVYARNREQLAQMCRGLASRVRSGGRFVTVFTNPDVCSFGSAPDYSKYHFTVDTPGGAVEGAPILITLHLPDSDLLIENYYLPISAYESALTEAGFHDVRVHNPQLSPAAQAEESHWDEFMKYPLLRLLECVRN